MIRAGIAQVVYLRMHIFVRAVVAREDAKGIAVQQDERARLRKEIEDKLLPFRIVQGRKGSSIQGGRKLRRDGWLRCIRQAAGLPVDEVARRLGVSRWEINRLEASERNARIMLETLSRAAKGLGCELVYALVPMEQTLQQMAEIQLQERETKRDKRREERERKRREELEPWLGEVDWEDSFLKAMRTYLRRQGMTVRPRKTENGTDEQLKEFEEKLRLLARERRAAVKEE